ncbi:hypothetical protein [Virgibacillus sp. SK37]|uniref:hypothetical protein n=1 Tax=Virgibacillus sp. SK37 TaxID=403957 RepID=UPI0004D1962F|nr:hypothetical protein [Virgibacillus sp. SK37]AIF42806.1 hypothetical protein X953_05775 [Virgibacillus sp. SK37]
MKYWFAMFLLFLVVLLGGCQEDKKQRVKPSEMHVEDLPDVRAFEDEFTREFLQSTEETREGYYSFLSGAGAYKMDFPASGIVSEKSYSIKKDGFESFFIGVNQLESEALISVNYNSMYVNIESMQDILRKQLDEDLKFNKYDSDDLEIHAATFTVHKGYGMAGMILNKKWDGGGVLVTYETNLINKNKQRKQKEIIIKWMKSFKFNNMKND